jgi:hypothetical protein
MKNKTLKNLIALGAFAIFVLGTNSVSAYGTAPFGYSVDYSWNPNTNYPSNYSSGQNYYNSNNTQTQYDYNGQQQAQQVQYVQQPVQQVQYVPVKQTVVQYVPAQQTAKTVAVNNSTQGASALGSTNNKVVASNKNTGTTGNTGQYVNYDANGMLANAYGAYNNQPIAADDSNGVTALTVKGSGSFMPSSVFQWFLLILLILGIIIVARMVSKTFSKDVHSTPAH